MSARISLGLDKARTAPTPIRFAYWTTLGWAAFTAIGSVMLLAYKPYVHDELIKSNAKAKDPTPNYVGSVVDHDVNQVVYGGLATGLIAAFILVVLAIMVLRARGLARWVLILLATVLPFVVRLGLGIVYQLVGGLASTEAPVLYRIVLVIGGLCAVGVLVLMLLPETTRYFAANRAPRVATAGGRPGLGSLFGSAGGRPARQPLFGPRRGVAAPARRAEASDPAGDDQNVGSFDVAADDAGDDVPANRPVRKRPATRPGSVKPKGGAPTRPARAKSRNQ